MTRQRIYTFGGYGGGWVAGTSTCSNCGYSHFEIGGGPWHWLRFKLHRCANWPLNTPTEEPS